MKKRILSLLLAVFMLAAALSGCGGDSGKDPAGSKAGGNTGKVDDGVPDMDLNGYEFVIAEGWYYDSTDKPNMEPGSSDLTDAILERNKTIEKRFNCKIVYDYYDPVSFYDTVYPLLMSGEKFADVMTPCMFNYGKFAVGGYLYDLNTLPHVKLDQDYWYDVFGNAVKTSDGKQLGASNFMANPYRRSFGVFFNKRLVSELNLENPYDLLKQGKWNWETFQKVVNKAMKDVNGDASFTDDDVYSVTGGLDGGIQALYISSGQKMFDIDGSGKIRYAMTDDGVLPVLNTLKDMFAAPGSYYSGSWDASRCTQQFVDGKVTFYLNLAAKSTALRDMKDDYGLVPLPMAPNQSQYSSPIDHNTAVVCVPSTIDNPEATGAVLQAIAAASASEKQIWQDEVAGLNYRDDESYQNWQEYMLPNISFDVLFMYHKLAPEFFKYTTTTVWQPVVRDRTLDAATLISAGKEVVQTKIDEILNQ